MRPQGAQARRTHHAGGARMRAMAVVVMESLSPRGGGSLRG